MEMEMLKKKMVLKCLGLDYSNSWD